MTSRVGIAAGAEHFARLTRGIHELLPGRLAVVPLTGIGFAILGLICFGIDIALLSLLHGALNVAYPLAVTLGYAAASVANFVFNRWLNFRSHGDVAKQSSKQLVVAVSNYLIWILAFSTLLEAIGMQYQLARVLSACIEAVYLYAMMRLWVFPRSQFPELTQGRSRHKPAELSS